MIDILKRFPFHPFILVTYFILFLLAQNIEEVAVGVIERPIIIAELASLFLLIILWLVTRDISRAALMLSFVGLLFFSYGHVYRLLNVSSWLIKYLGRHRYLLPIYAVILVLGVIWIMKRIPQIDIITLYLNLASILLISIPIYIIINYSMIQKEGAKNLVGQFESPSSAENLGELPDIYYIILDAYARQDVLQLELGFDNSPFIDQLRAMGFYVADCSRSNYEWTASSLLSSMNMAFAQDIYKDVIQAGLPGETMYTQIKWSKVRDFLESMGYQTVAFDSGFEWSRLRDADIYLEVSRDGYAYTFVTPFEYMLIDSTMIIIVSSISDLTGELKPPLWIGHRYEEKIKRELFKLDMLPSIVNNQNPTFTFVHMIVPHKPYIFGPTGEIRTDTDFYSNPNNEPVDYSHFVEGYTGQIMFINSRMVDIVQTILERSEIKPIIIIQGDHGFRGEEGAMERLSIFNAYFLPDGYDQLYPSISPINSFRLIFNEYFSASYELLPDFSYFGKELELVEETSPSCTVWNVK